MKIFAFIIVLITLVSCKKDISPTLKETLNGKWELSLTSGGIAGKIENYPAGNGRVFEFTASTYKDISNQQVISSGGYAINKGISILTQAEGNLLVFENNEQKYFFTVSGNQLEISHDVYDGQNSTYRRIE